jgi:pyruvate dehydrogenase E2 component (dihydrolipoyllysine-residue acetyltransferase)
MDVLMPQLGETVTEGKVAAWFKAVGDNVAAGENLFEIETDKVTMEVPAAATGVLSEIKVAAGETVKVGAVLAVLDLGTPGWERMESATAAAQTPAPKRLDPFAAVRTPTRSFGRATGPLGLKLTPLARRLAAEGGHDLAVVAEDVRARGGRRIAAIDVKRVQGAAKPAARAPQPQAAGTIAPLSRIRAQTASRLAQAWRTIPHVFQAVEVDFSAVERSRGAAKAEFAARHGVALSYLPFVARAACLAIGEFRRINASFADDRLVLHADVNLGIAVDLAHEGLIVPVVRQADGMTAGGLARAIARQVEKARQGKLAPADIEGASYTITNNGSFGTLFTTPIINPPQVAILSMDAVRKRAVVVETEHGDAFAARPIGIIGQSFDHRAFDGAYSASFLRRLKAILETRDWAVDLA